MSYLLKAMKKAEQERKAIQEQPVQISETKVVSAGLPLPLVGVVLFVCAVVLAQVFVSGGEDELQQSSQEQLGMLNTQAAPIAKPQKTISEPKENKAVAIKAVAEEKAKDEFAGFEVIRPNDSNSQTYEAESQSVYDKPEEWETPQGPQVKQLEQLSKATLSTIPSMQLESHIYSSAEDFRSVVINGRSFNQGDYFSPDVVLHQITEDGVVIQVNGELVAMPKGISWVASNGQ